ncbi:glutamate ligase domain-containing protein [Buchnera aphidicola]|uniref:glutamate ligase domain-containing protein n=1 Tax=Buchnera aphidicola TaxID=9 RepID=UPI000ACDD564|nr:cyanophycin synthetase [Buchnera aphidicola]
MFANRISISNQGSSFSLHSPYWTTIVNLPLLGFHNISNALAAISIAIILKIPIKIIKLGLSKIPKLPGRLEIIKLDKNKTIIDDTYNANVASMITAIKVLENMPGYKIFISGNMSELGKDDILYHKIIGNFMYISNINEVLSIGELSKNISVYSNKGNHYYSYQTLVNYLIKKMLLHKEFTILVKGSRSEKLENLVNKIIQEYNYGFNHH